MKNIHIIPTDKLSILVQRRITKELILSSLNNPQLWYNVNMYITSNEEIKVGDWCINLNSPYPHKELCRIDYHLELERYTKKTGNDCKKIILTTDQDLIKDGVQSINDEFLEWIVKNPSCENVDVNDWLDTNGNIAFGRDKRYQICNHLNDKIIIPKEESKQETLEDIAFKKYPRSMSEQDSKLRSVFLEGLHKGSCTRYTVEDLKRAHWHGWLMRERLADQIPEMIFPPKLDYEGQEEYAFNKFLKQLNNER